MTDEHESDMGKRTVRKPMMINEQRRSLEKTAPSLQRRLLCRRAVQLDILLQAAREWQAIDMRAMWTKAEFGHT